MKNSSALLCLGMMIALFNGCKKTEVTEESFSNTSLIGTWELRQAQVSMTPTIEYPSGKGNIVKFTESTYEIYRDGNLDKSGNYAIIKDTTVETEVGLVIPDGQFTHRIIFDNSSSAPKTFLEISNNMLTLLSGYFPLDGGSRISYERLADNHE